MRAPSSSGVDNNKASLISLKIAENQNGPPYALRIAGEIEPFVVGDAEFLDLKILEVLKSDDSKHSCFSYF